MKIDSMQFKDNLGREVVLRNAEISDAAALIDYLKITAAETSYLIREPEEITITLEQEKNFIESKINEPGELLLVALIDGKHIGNCSFMSIAPYMRYAHRCEIAIALYRSLGFEKYGSFPNNMKYSDGTYANADWMMKKL